MKLAVAVLAVIVLIAVLVFVVRRRGVTQSAIAPADLVPELRRDVEKLCAAGPRNTFERENLAASAGFIASELAAAGYRVERQTWTVDQDQTEASNIIVELHGTTRPEEIIVIGAHYDSVDESPGADDNASGTAVLLAIARRLAHEKPSRTLRFVAFANEEPPHFQSEDMGSLRYARRCHERGETIAGMISIESVGYYTDAARSQQYPQPLAALYPSTGNFAGFVGNIASRALVMRSLRAFRDATPFPAEGAVLPELIQEIGWSDQWAFWQFGWPAIMVTDTAPYRNPNYHTVTDTPETLDYERMAAVTQGLVAVVKSLGQ